MLDEIAHLRTRISFSLHDIDVDSKLAAELGVDKVPGIAIRGAANRVLRFSGFPFGGQFPPFIDAIIDSAATTAAGLKPETQRQLKKLKDDVRLQLLVSPACPYSPAMAAIAYRLGLASSRIHIEVIEAAEFPGPVQRLGVTATPVTLIDDRLLLPGAIDEAALLQAVFRVVDGKPLAAADFKSGPTTPLPQPQSASDQSRPLTSAGGIILPR
jgi:alkyl hydroperoxide reductase subunit AhpF